MREPAPSRAPAGEPAPAGIGKGVSARQVCFPDEWYLLASPDHFWLQWRLRAALCQIGDVGLPLAQPLRVLDVGGGTGALRQQLEACSAWTIDITDLHPSALHWARPGRGRDLCYDVRDERPELLAAYDVVILFDVLEHIERPASFLASLLRHLRRGGHLLVNVPALPVLFSAYDVAAGHLRRYRRRSLVAEFEGVPIEVCDVRYWGLSLVPLLFLRKLVLRSRSGPDAIRAGFRPPSRSVEAWLRTLMRLETAVCRRPAAGTSLLLAGRKPA